MIIRLSQRLIPAALSAAIVWTCPVHGAPSSPESSEVRVAFGRDCRTLLVGEVDKAQKDILVACFTFTDSGIVRALTEAAGRGVKVAVKYDARQAEFEGMRKALDRLKQGGVSCEPVVMPGEQANMHHKFAVIDEDRVLTGSFNFTSSASRVNYENMVLIRSRPIARAFSREFASIKGR